MVTVLKACTVPIALSSTGTSAAWTVPAVTGTPGAAGGGAGASAAGAECRFRYATEPAPDTARTAVATNTAFFMPDASLGRALSLADAKSNIEPWRRHYNESRPPLH